MEEENEYELARQQRIAANKAKLASLQVRPAAVTVLQRFLHPLSAYIVTDTSVSSLRSQMQ